MWDMVFNTCRKNPMLGIHDKNFINEEAQTHCTWAFPFIITWRIFLYDYAIDINKE